jgi:hypothetical protein
MGTVGEPSGVRWVGPRPRASSSWRTTVNPPNVRYRSDIERDNRPSRDMRPIN